MKTTNKAGDDVLPSLKVQQAAATNEIAAPGVETEYRAAGPDDEATINSAFLRGLRESSYTFGLDSDTFYGVGRQIWGNLRKEFETTIAHVAGDPNEVQGFVTHAMVEGDRGQGTVPCVAWLYVAKAWRKLGVGTSLLTKAGISKRERFPVLFANPQKLAVFRSKGYQPAFVPFKTWEWLK